MLLRVFRGSNSGLISIVEVNSESGALEPAEKLQAIVLAVHRRNGGTLATLDPSRRLLDPELRLDSLDLAEIMVAIEREFGVSPFEAPQPPRTWADVTCMVAERGRPPQERP